MAVTTFHDSSGRRPARGCSLAPRKRGAARRGTAAMLGALAPGSARAPNGPTHPPRPCSSRIRELLDQDHTLGRRAAHPGPGRRPGRRAGPDRPASCPARRPRPQGTLRAGVTGLRRARGSRVRAATGSPAPARARAGPPRPAAAGFLLQLQDPAEGPARFSPSELSAQISCRAQAEVPPGVPAGAARAAAGPSSPPARRSAASAGAARQARPQHEASAVVGVVGNPELLSAGPGLAGPMRRADRTGRAWRDDAFRRSKRRRC